MADGVLPAGLVAAVEGEIVGDVLVDLVECQPLLGRALYGHGNESGVGVRRADQAQHVVRAGHGEPGAAEEMREEASEHWKASCRESSGASCDPRDGAQVWATEVGVTLDVGRWEPRRHRLAGLRRSWRAVQAEVRWIEAQRWKLLLGERASTQRGGQTLLRDEGRHAGNFQKV